MVQVLSVSATTAAYAMDAVRPPQKINRSKTFTEDNSKLAADDDSSSVDARIASVVTFVKPSSLALSFLTSGSHRNAQATFKEVLSAYKENAGTDK